jgi:UTP--glucose-1-phosphate uridylyltransferase
MKQRVTKAVIAAAGFGTRFLPQTKAMPKEMLPIVDKPVIQLLVEQLVEAGVRDIIIVTGYTKRAIEDHFDKPNEELLANLKAGGKAKAPLIDEVNAIAELANFVYVRQRGPYGTATPLMNAAPFLGDEPFFYIFADDITVAQPNPFTQLLELHDELGGCIMPCVRLTRDDEYRRYGIVAGQQIKPNVMKVERLVEKPAPADAPSNFANVGGYLLTPEVLPYLQTGLRTLPAGEEFGITDKVFAPMMATGLPFYGIELQNSVRFDTGNKLEYLKAVFYFAMQRDDIARSLRDYLRTQL